MKYKTIILTILLVLFVGYLLKKLLFSKKEKELNYSEDFFLDEEIYFDEENHIHKNHNKKQNKK